MIRMPRRGALFTVISMLAATQAFAAADTTRTQPGPWTYGATAALNLSQSVYSGNWKGGDRGSINWILQGDMKAERQMKIWFNVSNLLQLAYGQTAKQVADSSDLHRIAFQSPEKTTDLILAESTGRFTLDTWVDPFIGLRLESQFSDQSDPRGLLFNPVRFTQTAGVARVLVKDANREWLTRLGLSVRETFSKAYVDKVSDETSSSTSVDGGMEWLSTVDQPLIEKRILYKGRLLVFVPLFFDHSSDLEEFDRRALAFDPNREAVQDFWKAPNVNFQNTFTAPLTSNLNVNLYVQWVYVKFDQTVNIDLGKFDTSPADRANLIATVDGAIRKAGQFKQTLAIGLTYTLF